MTQLTLDQAAKEKARQEALERLRYAPHGTIRKREAVAVAATCAALAADPSMPKATKGKHHVV